MSRTILPSESTEVELATEGMQAFTDYVESLPDSNPEDVQERIIRAIMTATTAEEIINAGAATKAEDVVGIPLQFLNISRADSSFADAGGKYYLHIECRVIASGDKITVATGSQDVCVKLVRLHQLGLLPISGALDKATKATANGFYPLFLRAIPAPF